MTDIQTAVQLISRMPYRNIKLLILKIPSKQEKKQVPQTSLYMLIKFEPGCYYGYSNNYIHLYMAIKTDILHNFADGEPVLGVSWRRTDITNNGKF